MKTISLAIAAIAWIATPLLSYLLAPTNLTMILLGSITAAIAIGVWLICNKLERKFIYGQETPLRNS
jgi:hypothetical protein